jgi:hypothetical protein
LHFFYLPENLLHIKKQDLKYSNRGVYCNMSEEKKNPIAEILARKKAQKNGYKQGFNPNEAKNMKPQKGSNGPAIMRKQGRGS